MASRAGASGSRPWSWLLVLLLVVAAASGGPRARGDPGPLEYGDDGDGDVQDKVPAEPAEPAEPTEAPVCPERCVCRPDENGLRVDCSGRRLKAFPRLTDVPEDVGFLDLSDNEIESVPQDLPAWELLEGLSLAGNRLDAFPPRALADLPALEILDLSRNAIASLRRIKPDRVLLSNPKLQVLNLSGNGLQDLGHGSFQSLSSESLQLLDVSNCSISSIDGEAALAELPRLSTLRVAGNPLQALPALNAPTLRELDVSDCRLRRVSAHALLALPVLQYLYANRNPDLGHFVPPAAPTPKPDDADPLQLAYLTNGTPPWSSSLQVLEAENCVLQDMSFLSTMPNLIRVRLRGNRIDRLEPLGLLDNGALLHLDLADNKLEDIPVQAFKGTELLRELDLSGNSLTAIHPDTFAQHAALRELNVSRNPMASLQLSSPGLQALDASHGQLKVLPSAVLDGTPRLRHLNLSNNPLASLPDRLAGAGNDAAIQSLDLSLCRLTDLSLTTLDGLPMLQFLDLSGNRFTDPIKVAAFNENVVLQQVQLDDNPWRCDCGSKDFLDFADFLLTNPAKEDTLSLTCHSPERAQGLTWYAACLGPGAGSLAFLQPWVFGVILGLCVALVAGGVFVMRRFSRAKTRRRRQQEQDQDEERRACDQEAAQRRLHRRMQQQQQEELRRQNIRAQAVSTEEPQPHPPSYEEAVLMDRMTADLDGDADSDSDPEDEAFREELRKKVARMSSTGRTTDVIHEEEDEAAVAGTSTEVTTPPQSNGNAHKFDTRL